MIIAFFPGLHYDLDHHVHDLASAHSAGDERTQSRIAAPAPAWWNRSHF